MATFQFEDSLEANDLIFIPGLGFRGEEECEQLPAWQSRKQEQLRYSCEDVPYGFGKDGLDKWEPLFPPFAGPPIYFPPATYIPPVTYWPPSTYWPPGVIFPPTSTPPTITGCCVTPLSDPPPMTPVPGPAAGFLLGSVMIGLIVWRSIQTFQLAYKISPQG